MKLNITVVWIALLTLWALPGVAAASAPGPITYRGVLHNAQDEPLNATITAVFMLYDAQTDGMSAWEQTFSTIEVSDGEFAVELGDESSDWRALFDGRDFWLDVTINGERLEPRVRLTSVPYALRAASAASADTLGGKSAEELIAESAARPIAATTITFDPGTSGLSATDVQAALLELAQLKSRITILEQERNDYARTADLATYAKTTDLAAYATTAEVQTALADYARTSTLDNYVKTSVLNSTLNNYVKTSTLNSTLNNYASKSSVTALETKTAKMTRETIDGQDSIVFTGVNVHVRNGHADAKTTTTNGAGNLIIGYNEPPSGSTVPDRRGSHNLITGIGHQWSGYGGMAVGYQHTISGNYASVSGGYRNQASGNYASVSGGANNTAEGIYASVSGGSAGKATGSYASVSGGINNDATGSYASVSGGSAGKATGNYSSVSGGYNNQALRAYTSVTGGSGNIAGHPNSASYGYYASISGGSGNRAMGEYSSIAGGIGNVTGDPNTSSAGYYSTVSGGQNRTAPATNNWRGGTYASSN